MGGALRTSQAALQWMLQQKIVIRSKMKDPETFAAIQGFMLSSEMRESIGSILIELVAKQTHKRSNALTLRDAFLAATIAAVLRKTGANLSEDEMTTCANIISAMLPIAQLEQAGLADQRLGMIARDRNKVGELQRLLRIR